MTINFIQMRLYGTGKKYQTSVVFFYLFQDKNQNHRTPRSVQRTENLSPLKDIVGERHHPDFAGNTSTHARLFEKI